MSKPDLNRVEWNDPIYIDYIQIYKDEIYID